MDQLVRTDPIYSLLEKLAGAVIAIILMIFVVPPALNVFGINPCTGCDPLVSVFAIGVLPVAAVFIVFYIVMRSFTEKS